MSLIACHNMFVESLWWQEKGLNLLRGWPHPLSAFELDMVKGGKTFSDIIPFFYP